MEDAIAGHSLERYADVANPVTSAPGEALCVEYTVGNEASVRLQRFPAEARRRLPAVASSADKADVHLIRPADYPIRTLRHAAAILTGQMSEPGTWFSDILERYYDAHLYLANWGTRHMMPRLPRSLVAAEQPGDAGGFWP